MHVWESVKKFFEQKGCSAKKLAGLIGLHISQIYRYGEDPNGPSGTRIPADMIPLLTKLTGNYLLIHNLCQLCGCLCIPLDIPSNIKSTDFIKVVQKQLYEIKKIVDANADGILTSDEIKEIKRIAYETMSTTAIYIASIEEKEER